MSAEKETDLEHDARVNGGGASHPHTLKTPDYWHSEGGLTKRELLAAMAMQGMVSNTDISGNEEEFALYAVKQADALLVELEKGGGE